MFLKEILALALAMSVVVSPVLNNETVDSIKKLSTDTFKGEKQLSQNNQVPSTQKKVVDKPEIKKQVRQKPKPAAKPKPKPQPQARPTVKSKPKVKQKPSSSGKVKKINKKKQSKGLKTFTATITAYTNGVSETGKSKGHPDYGITASGTRARAHHTIAMSRSYPFGTVVKIDGLPGTYVVEDRGGAIKGNKIDLFVSNTKEAKEWGVQKRKVTIIKWGKGR